MEDKLAGLSGAAGEEGAEDGDVEAALQGSVDHLHIWRRLEQIARIARARGNGQPREAALDVVRQNRFRFVAGTTAGGLLAAIELGHVCGIHVDGGKKATAKHALPLVLLDVLAVVGAGHGLGDPFLLEEGLCSDVWRSQAV